MSNNREFFRTNLDIYSKLSEQKAEDKALTSSSEWVKLQARQDPYIFRFQPPWDSTGLPFLTSYNHNFLTHRDQEGREFGVSPVCLKALFSVNNKSLVTYAVKAKKITRDDHRLFQEHGCPICLVSSKIKSFNERLANKIQCKPKYIGAVLDRETDTLKYFSLPNPVYDQVMDKLTLAARTQRIDLINPINGFDTSILVRGEKLQRKYTVDFFREASDFDYDGDLLPLDKAFVTGVRGYNEMCDIINNTPEVRQARIEAGIKL